MMFVDMLFFSMMSSILFCSFPLWVFFGLILIWRGLRGVVEFSEPLCTHCQYDLRALDWTSDKRNCPECGADLKKPKVVRFGVYRKRPRRIIAGAVLIMLPFLIAGAMILPPILGWSWDNIESNEAVIARLATGANQWLDWSTLENRYAAGDLSDEEISTALDQLIVYLENQTDRQPLHYADNFFKLAQANGLIGEEQFARLVDGFYGPTPELEIRKRIRQGADVRIDLNYGQHWNLPGLVTGYVLESVQLDGKEVKVKSHFQDESLSGGKHKSINGSLHTTDLPAGKHTLVFNLTMGLFDENAKFNPRYQNRPGPVKRWPETKRKWTLQMAAPLHILGPDEHVVTLIEDAKVDPVQAGQLSIETITVSLARNQQKELELRTEIKQNGGGDFVTPVMFRMVMLAEGEEYELGWFGQAKNSSTSSSTRYLDALPPGLFQVNVRLTPDIALAEEHMDTDAIWGKPIVIKNVQLLRYDLEE